jgi:hypothetical protein
MWLCHYFWNKIVNPSLTLLFGWELDKNVVKGATQVCRNPSLRLTTKARGCKVTGKRGAGSHAACFQECKNMWGNRPSHSQGNSHFGELESWWTPEFLERDCKGQNPSPWGVLYIIENILKRICLKWACMTHLDIWNTSYGQKKGQKSNWQFDSRPQKVGNRPDFLACRWRATRRWKALDKDYNFALDFIPIGSLHTKL